MTNCEICNREILPSADYDSVTSADNDGPVRNFHAKCVQSLRCSYCKKPISNLRDWLVCYYKDKSKPEDNYHPLCYYELTGDDIITWSQLERQKQKKKL